IITIITELNKEITRRWPWASTVENSSYDLLSFHTDMTVFYRPFVLSGVSCGQLKDASGFKHTDLHGVVKYDIKDRKQIGFLVGLKTTLQNRQKGSVVIYDKVITNDGNGYNPSTGIFTASVEANKYFYTYLQLQLGYSKSSFLDDVYCRVYSKMTNGIHDECLRKGRTYRQNRAVLGQLKDASGVSMTSQDIIILHVHSFHDNINAHVLSQYTINVYRSLTAHTRTLKCKVYAVVKWVEQCMSDQISNSCTQKIGFLVSLKSHTKNRIKGSIVIYDSVITNVSNGYNPSTGIFTASAEGLYSFSLTTTTKANKYFFKYLTGNGHMISRNHAGHNNVDLLASQTVVVHLKKNDKVSIKIQDSSVGQYIYSKG
ncbi:Hypothetical predicted protein, partial [Mytilus galloprovincialis]